MFRCQFVVNSYILFGTRKFSTLIHFLVYKCPNRVSHSLIILAVSFGAQIRQIFKNKLSSRRYQSPLDPILQFLMMTVAGTQTECCL